MQTAVSLNSFRIAITANPSNINELVSQKMIEEFQEQYLIFQEDSKKYADETIEQRESC